MKLLGNILISIPVGYIGRLLSFLNKFNVEISTFIGLLLTIFMVTGLFIKDKY